MVSSLDSPPRTVSSPPGEIAFRVHGSSLHGQVVRLRSSKCTIGSGRQCTLRLRAAGIRPVHCFIVRGTEETVVRCWSPGTRLNGRRFTDAVLSAGDRLTIGPVELEFLGQEESARPQQRRIDSALPVGSEADGAQLEALRQALFAAESRSGELAAELRSSKQRLADIEAALIAAENRPSAATSSDVSNAVNEAPSAVDREAMELERDALETKTHELDEQAKRLEQEQGEIQRKRAQLQQELEQFRASQVAFEDAQVQAHKELDRQFELLTQDRQQTQQLLSEWQQERRQAQLDVAEQLNEVDRQRQAFLEQEATEVLRLSEQAASVAANLAELEKEKASLAEQRRQFESNRQQAASDQRFETSAATEIELLRQDLTTAREKAATLESELAAADTRRVQLEAELRRAEVERQSLETKQRSTENELLSLRDSVQFESQRSEHAERQVAEMRAQLNRMRVADEQSTANFEELQAQQLGLEAEQTAWNQTREQEQQQLEAQSQELESARLQLETKSQQFETTLQQIEADRSALEAERQSIAGQAGKLAERSREIDVQYAEIESLRLEIEAERIQQLEATSPIDPEQLRQLEAMRGELDLMRQELAAKHADLERLTGEFETQRVRFEADKLLWTEQSEAQAAAENAPNPEKGDSNITSLLAELEGREAGLREREEAFEQAREEARERLRGRSAELDAREAELEERAAQIESSAAQIESGIAESRQQQSSEISCHRDEQPNRESYEAEQQQVTIESRDESTLVDNEESPTDPSEEHSSVGKAEPAASSNEDVFERLRRLAMLKDEEEEAGNAGPMSPPPAPPVNLSALRQQPATSAATSSHSEDEEESIDQYMARLLNRVRGGDAPATGPAPSSRPAPSLDQLREKSNPSSPSTEQEPVVAEAVEQSAKPVERTRVAPPETSDLSKMRELANLQARTAIATHAKKGSIKDAGGRWLVAVVCGGVTGFAATQCQPDDRITQSGVAVGACVTLYWMYLALGGTKRFWSALRARRPKKAAPKQTTPAVKPAVEGIAE